MLIACNQKMKLKEASITEYRRLCSPKFIQSMIYYGIKKHKWKELARSAKLQLALEIYMYI